MIAPEHLKLFQQTFDKCSVDIWECLMSFKKDMERKMIADGLPTTNQDPEKVAEASVLWMIDKYHEDHIDMAKAQSFIDEIFPNKVD